MLISAQHIGGTESFLIEIEAPKVQGLLAQFDGDLTLVANHLKLMQNKMCLLNPVSKIWIIKCFRNLIWTKLQRARRLSLKQELHRPMTEKLNNMKIKAKIKRNKKRPSACLSIKDMTNKPSTKNQHFKKKFLARKLKPLHKRSRTQNRKRNPRRNQWEKLRRNLWWSQSNRTISHRHQLARS